jgi:hypothetical protein
MSTPSPRRPATRAAKAKKKTLHTWRMATAGLRPLPRIVVVGAQRSGTTSLHSWLCSHPDVAPFMIKEVHYFDGAYEKGERWYRSRFPISLGSRRQVEASPYMLYHPLAAERAGRDLPQDTRFVALLREPAERALSHYQLERRKGHESETFDRALELEESRLMGTEDAVARGARSRAHRWFSYRSRGRYAGQLSRWFDSVGRERILVLESERMFDDPSAPGELLAWLGLAPVSTPFPALNATAEPSTDDASTRDRLRASYEPDNEALFDLLGRRLWTERSR